MDSAEHADFLRQNVEYRDIAFDDFVKARQGFLEIDLPREQDEFDLDPMHRSLIKSASYFYLATVTGAGCPYSWGTS